MTFLARLTSRSHGWHGSPSSIITFTSEGLSQCGTPLLALLAGEHCHRFPTEFTIHDSRWTLVPSQRFGRFSPGVWTLCMLCTACAVLTVPLRCASTDPHRRRRALIITHIIINHHDVQVEQEGLPPPTQDRDAGRTPSRETMRCPHGSQRLLLDRSPSTDFIVLVPI